MKLFGIFRFEFLYQIRRPWAWLSMVVLLVFAFEVSRAGVLPVTLPQDFILNSPFIITVVTVLSCQIWLLVAPGIAGEAAARDVHTGMHPLVYTTPVTRAEYLAGRFLAAFTLNALILLAVQGGALIAVYGPWTNPEVIGPFRPAAYLRAYGFIALTNAFIGTTVQFCAALLSGRSMASYAGSFGLFFLSYPVTLFLYMAGFGERALLADPIGVLAIMNEMMSNWTIAEKNVRMFTLEGAMLLNRVLWLSVSVVVIALVYLRFRFAHRTDNDRLSRLRGRLRAVSPTPAAAPVQAASSSPQPRRSFGAATSVRQTLAIARSSFTMMARNPAGLFLLIAFPLFVALVLVVELQHWGVPLLPRTGYILAKHVTAPLTYFGDYRVMIPLLTIYLAGELVWRERDAGMSENVDVTPVPDRVLFLGKLLGLAFVLAAAMASLAAAGFVSQAILGYYRFEPGVYLTILFGLQLPEYLLFAVLVLVVQTIVNQKHAGIMVSLVAYLLIVLAPFIGIQHNLLVYSSGPEWVFTDMRGFGPVIGPWLWLKLYWAAWALLLAVLARLFWVRGREAGLHKRLYAARLRFTRSARTAAALAAALILTLGGFIFYNTNVLNEYRTDEDVVEHRAEYERRYGRYEGKPQPARVATSLNLEIHPDRGTARMRGTYRLVNRHAVAIDSIHLEPAFYVDTDIAFDRPFRQVVADDQLGHHIYALQQPLQPGDSLTLSFDVQYTPRGFTVDPISLRRSRGATRGVFRNGTYLTSGALPVIGYQPMRELWGAEDRRKHGLPRQLTLPPPGDIDPGVAAGDAATFNAVISTDADQVAVAPGELRRSWRKGGRRYFHYASDVPIRGEEAFFSARYAVHRERWKHVDIQIFLHPGHTHNLERMLRSVRAALDYFSAQFGPYPQRFLQIAEQPGNFLGLGVDGSGVITGGEGYMLLNPQGDGFDVIFEAVAHEMGHQWWGMQLKPAFAEGGGVISESLAWYSAMQLVKQVKGRAALMRFMQWMREPNPWPPMRTGLPLLRAMDPWANYRKGPYAMHALSEYAGEDRVNGALRTLLQKKASTLATTLDLYRELKAVTPDSLQPLLADLFEKNTFWTFDTMKATAVRTTAGAWQVSFEVKAMKVTADSTGREVEVPMNEWVEIGVFGEAEPGQGAGNPLYVQKHRIRSGSQTITITVAEKPVQGGIDPYNLLDWEEGNNIEVIEVKERSGTAHSISGRTRTSAFRDVGSRISPAALSESTGGSRMRTTAEKTAPSGAVSVMRSSRGRT